MIENEMDNPSYMDGLMGDSESWSISARTHHGQTSILHVGSGCVWARRPFTTGSSIIAWPRPARSLVQSAHSDIPPKKNIPRLLHL